LNKEYDRAKQDVLLVVIGGVAALVFFWLYSGYHPLGEADPSLQDTQIQRLSSELMQDFGYQPEDGPVIQYKSNHEILDSLQVKHDFHDYYSNPVYRSLSPVYYWNSRYSMGEEENGGSFSPFEGDHYNINIQFSENGDFIAFENSDQIRPNIASPSREESVLLNALLDSLGIMENDFNEIDFLMNQRPGQIADSSLVIEGGRLVLKSVHAVEMAHTYLEKSGWPAEYFERSEVDIENLDDIRVANVNFLHDGRFSDIPVVVTVSVLPTGELLSFTYNYETLPEQNSVLNFTITSVRVILVLIGVFWLVILLFVRFRMRLIDMKAAILVAVLAGVISPFVIFMQLLHTQIHSFVELNFVVVLAMLIPAGIVAALTSVVFFAVTSISDSITRKAWSEKLRTVDLFRIGQISNQPVGATLIRGIPYGFLILIFWFLSLYLFPGSYISVTEYPFYSDESYLAYITKMLDNGVIYMLMAEIIFLIFVGQLRMASSSPLLLIVLPAVLLGILHPFPFQVGDVSSELLSGAVIGLVSGWIYYKEDFLTTFIALVVFGTAVTSAPGWLANNSPDSLVFYSFILFVTAGFIYGTVNLFRGTRAKELPNFVPEYIQELAQEDRIKQELQIARKVQQSFLPVKTPTVEGLDIAAICKPAYETGGDYYDFIELDNFSYAIAIGDVSGKGIQAAFYMTFTKGVLHSLCNDYRSTIEVLTKANKLFRQNANRGTFISLIFGVISPGGKTFTFSRAGHNPLLYFENKTQILKEFKPAGLAIGMAEEEVFGKHITEEMISLSKGDILVLFTDGVVESVSKTNKVYGDSRLYNLVKKNHKESAQEIIRRIEADLDMFEEKSDQHDDMTMIVIKKN
jgi:hypothetical protein